ncbi:MAG TPA: YggS family pyridoxal phosphate-dependent enzyme [Candidatus Saccharimonadales bacterium]|nr:YggS family pyridoxal phosphate-dependent enzyme [Candidatus Saccharimonadales bacterium]
MSTEIVENLRRIQDRIAAAAVRAGRNPAEITLIGVSKTHPAAAIETAFQAGLRHFGENRVQEWEGKRAVVAELPATWHLIGHLQSNKAAKAARFFHSVDSLDDFALAQRLDRARAELPAAEPLRVLVEVHMGEETKSGVSQDRLPSLATQLLQLPHLNFVGLMTIPPFLDDPEAVRPYFAQLRHLRDALESEIGRKLPVLSMGMSLDFEAAIAEGATEVRVGTALFGIRTALP